MIFTDKERSVTGLGRRLLGEKSDKVAFKLGCVNDRFLSVKGGVRHG